MGEVTALGLGTAEITATASNGVTEYILLTVNPISVEELQMSVQELDLKISETSMLSVSIVPENATYKELSWSTSNPDVVVVSANGEVTAIGYGEALISAESHDGVQCGATIKVNRETGTVYFIVSGSVLVIIGGGTFYLFKRRALKKRSQ